MSNRSDPTCLAKRTGGIFHRHVASRRRRRTVHPTRISAPAESSDDRSVQRHEKFAVFATISSPFGDDVRGNRAMLSRLPAKDDSFPKHAGLAACQKPATLRVRLVLTCDRRGVRCVRTVLQAIGSNESISHRFQDSEPNPSESGPCNRLSKVATRRVRNARLFADQRSSADRRPRTEHSQAEKLAPGWQLRRGLRRDNRHDHKQAI